MNILTKIIICLSICIFSFQGFSGYAVPDDKDVISEINIQTASNPLFPFSINVLVWNVFKGDKDSWRSEFFKLSNKKDLLILQEAYLDLAMISVFELTQSFQYTMASSWVKDGIKSGVITGSKSSPENIQWQRSFYREPGIKTPKMTLFTKYKLAGHDQELLVGNIHAINFVRAYKLRHMLDQAAKVLKTHNGPAIFAGDFNTWTKTKLNNMKAVFKKLGFTQVRFKKDYRTSKFGNILDHVWVKDLKVLSALSPISKGSDHTPMEVQLSIY